ncbi:hypothetical protein Salat_2656000 [Sesamum alatum]|uniref:Uncharacterized protein n=1 Tax=Sesamum alatum TaxID=300844 RepID=A0AAE1XQ68_9LAMI|nr:hypothetical protein Salat_2656000 [Sesamum alatum]
MGGTLLFAIACAQVMYSFVMHPESLPISYQDFIQKTGPVAAPVYKVVMDCCRGSPVDVASLSKAVRDCCRGSLVDVASLPAFLCKSRGSNAVRLEEFFDIIPCSIIHPGLNSCSQCKARQ